MTREQALATVRQLAGTLDGEDEGARVARLMERVAGAEEPELLRQALAEVGALVVVREVRS